MAVDAGTRCIRLLLLESRFGELKIVRQDALDLQQEGLVAADELQAHLERTVADWGRPPLALVLPQQVTVTQLVELPPVDETEARRLIEDETVKLAGVNESALVSDFVAVPPQSGNLQSFWVSFCQESEIQNRITQLGLDHEDFRDITTTANALLTAWLAIPTRSRNVILVSAGAQGTTTLVVRNGTAVFASNFPMGGDFFTRAIARLRKCSIEAAEAAKMSGNLLAGGQAVAGFGEIVDGWAAELKRQLADWELSHHQAPKEAAAFELIAIGGVFEQAGFLEHLDTKCGLRFKHWPTDQTADALAPGLGFEIACGAALQALGHSPQPVSLVPANRRASWKRRRGRQQLEFANAVLLGSCLLALILGIWQKAALIQRKQDLAFKVQAGNETLQSNTMLTADLLSSYDVVRPLFEHEQTTADTLQALARLQQARSNRTMWAVLVADQQTYFSFPPTIGPTNKIAAAPTPPPVDPETGLRREVTNASPARPGLVVELCVPDSADGARNTLGLVVSSLKHSPVFSRVDLMSEDLRRSLADPKVLIRDRHFALALDFATAEFQNPLGPRRNRGARTTPRPPGGEEIPKPVLGP